MQYSHKHVLTYLSAAGYDMEDAMILNKSAVERGLGHATMLKTEQVDLSKESGKVSVLLALWPALCMLNNLRTVSSSWANHILGKAVDS